MAINKNHECEELNGVKCAIVEKNVTPERAEFLKRLLLVNRFEVVIAATAPPKAAPAKPVPPKPVVATEGTETVAVTSAPVAEAPAPPPPPPPTTFTVGVTDLRFNAINAIFGRLLKSAENRIVTLAYWQQKDPIPREEVPYYETKS